MDKQGELDKIRECKDCGTNKKPVLLNENIGKHTKVMVVSLTPQKNFSLEDIDKMIMYKRSLSYKVNKLLDEKFSECIKDGRVYWTHAVKCPHTPNETRSLKKDWNKRVKNCIEKHLFKEIEFLCRCCDLQLILTFGTEAGMGVYKKYGKGNCDEIKRITDVIEIFIKNMDDKNKSRIKINDIKQVYFFPLFHPSRENVYASKLKNPDLYKNNYKNHVREIFLRITNQPINLQQ